MNDSLALVLLPMSGVPLMGNFQSCFDIWVMGELSDKDSWTKKYTIRPFIGGHHFALGFRQNGEFLLVRSGLLFQNGKEVLERCGARQLFSYNLDTQMIKEYQVYDVPLWGGHSPSIQVLPYIDCLISVKRC